MRLYLNDTSPFSRLVLITALEAGVSQLDFVWVDPWASPESLLQLNPFSLVPTLEIKEEEALYESLFICDYLLAQGKGGLSHSSHDVERLQRYALGKLLMETAFKKVVNDRFSGPDHALSDRGIAALQRALAQLEILLAHQAAPLSLPDLCLAVALEYIQFRLPDVFAAHAGPQTLAWLTPYQNRPSFVATTPQRLKAQPASLHHL
ncbi:glutathione S-transferase family protein [Iodobacter fluviatilis]|uniref:Glutathione S-transferase n=1 Tax=Iodobacter fluviatilis TaxID=537 RepID=A0A377Q6H7_9NEIS|nr:glutathione S-transferase family protein [Iodobacter fluviatilis]TCU87004.1 glutathione S-transferase [Iodobacter fluviatilis]STQ90335.1 putative glutathione S-transferase [Iodobacter fluviatilis]